jgi:hypothetical protein
VDGPLKHSRSALAEVLKRQGVKEQTGQDLLQGIRVVEVADDLSHLVEPVAVPVGIYGGVAPAGGAVEYSGFELQVKSSGGAYALIASATADYIVLIGMTPQLPNNRVALGINWIGPTGESAAVTGTVTSPSVSVNPRFDNLIVMGGFWLPLGAYFALLRDTANTVISGGFMFQEVPSPRS